MAEVQRPIKGLVQDTAYVDQPKDSYRYALNAVDSTVEGDRQFISNEQSNAFIGSLPDGYFYLGHVYISDNEVAIWATNPSNLIEEADLICKLDARNQLEIVVQTNLGFNIKNQIEAEYRLRRGDQKKVYWVDGLNRPRNFNFSSPEDYYTTLYQSYLNSGGLPQNFIGQKWDTSSFELIKGVKSIPVFTDVDVIDNGNIPSGSYSFAIQFVDEDQNPTHWVTTSNPVNIFIDGLDKPYHRIRGSKNLQSDAQNFGVANKSIRISISNLDVSYPFYRIGIIQYNGVNGKATRAIQSELISTQVGEYLYSGNDTSLTEVPLTDIILTPEPINSPQHISQIDNKLIIANTRGSKYNWCDFQSSASKITTSVITEPIILNSVDSPYNIKNPMGTFMFRGYMPGEVYSFGVVYLINDNGQIIESPVCHVPGKNSGSATQMQYYEGNTIYNDIHHCEPSSNYWGQDALGQNLKGRKVRHHKFPTRKQLTTPLIDTDVTSVTITKYRLSFSLALASGQSWPLDTDGNPVLISYSLQYRPNYATAPYTYTGYLSIDDLGRDIIIYDDLEPPVFVSGSDYIVFDSSSQLIANYSANFDITKNNTSYIDSIVQEAIISSMLGIRFSGVEKPHPDVVGFYIVRHEREDSDRSVIDNAIMGLNIVKDQYRSFGLLIPKVEDAKKDDKSTWIFSPEHQFLKKKIGFTGISIQGYYEETDKNLPSKELSTLTDVNGQKKWRRYLQVDDVYPGTSYNSDVHKKRDKDDDGFALAIGYRNYMVSFSSSSGSYSLPAIDSVLYLDAAANKADSSLVYYNASVDNKIGIITYQSAIDRDQWINPTDDKIGRLLYVTLTKDNRDAYADFMVRPYFKEHSNPFMFGDQTIINNARVFNGDAYVSPVNLVNSLFWEQRMGDFNKKNKTWQIVAGAILIVVGIVAGIFTAGAGLTIAAAGVATAAAGLAISYGVSLAISGIKFEQMKSMIDMDYPKGLKDTIKDQDTVYLMDGIDNYPGPLPNKADDSQEDPGDDAFMWFDDRVSNLWIETTIPMALRSGLTAAVPDFVDTPQAQFDENEFRNYLTEKYTVLDRERGSGRLYKGYASAEFYDINPDYMRLNKEKFFYHLPLEYNCCSNDSGERFPMRIHYSQTSFQEEGTDNYASFLPNNYRDLEGETGEITGLYKVSDKLYIQTTESLWELPRNLQERSNADLITFIGTGDFFAIMPQKITDSDLGTAGTIHKWATVKSPYGTLIVSSLEGKVYMHSNGLKPISDLGNEKWFQSNLSSSLYEQVFRLTGQKIKQNNPANPQSVGIHATYDNVLKRFLITKRDYLVTPQYQNSIVSVPYEPTLGISDDTTYPISGFQIQVSPSGTLYFATYTINDALEISKFVLPVDFTNSQMFENKSWTISYSIRSEEWRSFHSYLPLFYITKQQMLISGIDRNLWQHHILGSYQNFYGVKRPHILEYVSSSPLATMITNSFSVQSTSEQYDEANKQFVDIDVFFNKMICFNSKQATLEHTISQKDSNSENYYSDQVIDNSAVIVSRTERDWNINEIRDYRVDYTKPIFSLSWNSVAPSYPIDKVLNLSTVSSSKDYTELQSLRDKYLAIRLIFDNFDNVQLTTNYVFQTDSQSLR